MEITRGGFLKLAAAGSAGLSAIGLGAATATAAAVAGAAPPATPVAQPAAGREAGGGPGGGEATAGSAGPAPGGSAGALDSQRFRAAVAAGDATLVAAYLRRDPALAGSRDEHGRSVLEIACLAGRREVVELLRRQPGRPQALELVEAALAGDAERVQWWLGKAPALVNEPDATGLNAVQAA